MPQASPAKTKSLRRRRDQPRWTQAEWAAWTLTQSAPGTPPGLPKPAGKPAKDKGERHSQVDPTVVTALFSQASEDVKAMLRKAGLVEPTPPGQSLEELCREHVETMPADIRKLLEEPGEIPTQGEAITKAGAELKRATLFLKGRITSKVQLQQKLDKAKEAYSTLLQSMGALNTEIAEAQIQAQSAQTDLQQQVEAAPQDGGLPNLQHVLEQAGVAVTAEQVGAIRAHLLTTQSGQPPAQELERSMEQLKQELQQAHDKIRQLTVDQPSDEAPAPKKPKHATPPEAADPEPKGAAASTEANRSRSPKNRSKVGGGEGEAQG